MLAPTASTGTGAYVEFSCVGAPNASPSFRAAHETSTHTISPGDKGRVGGDAGQGTSQ
jgi:hypothetical protein